MFNLQGSYFVASNVFLAATGTYISGNNEDLTNILTSGLLMDVDPNNLFDYSFTNAANSTSIIYWNAYTGIPA
jgi:hypothetical protein